MATQLLYIGVILMASLLYGMSNLFLYSKNWCTIERVNGSYNFKYRQKKESIISIIFEILSFGVLVIPLVTRNCGADTKMYYKIYLNGDKALEPCFTGLLRLLHKYITDPKFGIGILGALSVLIVFLAFRMLKSYISTSLCMIAYTSFLYFYLYNYVRMMLAASILVLSYAFILRGKKKEALLFMIFASCFHKSAVVVVGVYIILFLLKKHRKILTTGVFFWVIIFLSAPASYINIIDDQRFSAQVDQRQIETATLGMGTLIRSLPLLILIIVLYRKYNSEEEYYVFFYSMLINLGFSLVGYFVPITSRLANMFFVYHVIFYVPWLLKQEKRKDNRYMYTICFIAYCVINYYLISRNFKTMGIDPYY